MCTGMPFEINCSVDLQSVMGRSNFVWNIATPYENLQRQRRFFPANDSGILPIKLNSTTLNFSSRSFPQRQISTVFTDNATADLNGTVLTCHWELVFNNSIYRSDSVQIALVGDDAGNVNSKLLTLI